MDFSFTKEQQELYDQTVRFARAELNESLIELDKEQGFNREGWTAAARFGIQGLPIPEEYGGTGVDVVTTVRALEGLGYGCRDNGLVFSINAHIWTCAVPILTFGSEEQKRKYLPGLCDGTYVGGNAITEPDSGSDAYALRTLAERQGDYYVLNGSKTFSTNAPVADVLVIFATVDREKGSRGVTAFLVEKDTPGFTVGKKIDKMGVRTSPMGEIFFDNCHIPAENRLGKEGAGMAIFTHSMEWERGFILASAVGAMQRQLETCIRYARERKQFGQSIGKFQLVSSKIVDMKMRLELSRLMLYRGAWMKESGKSIHMDAAMTKLWISESWVQNSLDAIQIHGGYGFMTEYEVERELRDALGSRIYSGTSEIQRQIIAQFLRL